MKLVEEALKISRYKKERFLRSFTEDEFRDRVVRPLFLLRGMTDGRDLCGPTEAGKDAIFTSENLLGQLDVYALQTKRGNLNCGGKAAQNVVEATTQLKTALETGVMLIHPTKRKVRPNRAILAASGKINETARAYVSGNVGNPNISFLDSDDLIPDIDRLMPEIWFDIDANLFPYLRAVKQSIEKGTQLFTRGELIAANLKPVAVSEDSFVSLSAYRYALKRVRRRGTVEQVADLIRVPITSLASASDNLVLLLGGAGAGKSTALLRMIYILCEKIEKLEGSAPVPVFFRAQELTSPAEKLLDAVFTRMQEIGGTKETPIGSKELNAGLLSLFVDGLDELPNTDVRKAVVGRLLEFSKVYPKCKVILASRPYYTVEQIPSLAHFTEYHVAPMTYKEGQLIVKRLHKPASLSVPKAGEFLRQLQEVHGIELNPLIITVFAASCEVSRSDIPANITELFKKFTEQMLGRWDEGKGLEAQYQSPLKDFVLTRVAYHMHSRKVTALPLPEFRGLVGNELNSRGHKANTEMLTDEILERSGLFRINNDQVEFRHLMLQEFFAGRGLPSGNVVSGLITDEWWRRALVFYFGDRPNEGNALIKLSNELDAAQRSRGLVAAVTLGLAVQASYLIETTTKLPLVYWIFRKLAEVTAQFDKEVVKSAVRPLDKFIDLVLTARDAVAFSFLKENRKAIRAEVVENQELGDNAEIRQFWLIIGLIESGDLEGALNELRSFRPKDRRLFLGLHLGAFLINWARVTTPAERKLAKKICDQLNDKVSDLREQLVQEWKSELLEYRKGRIEALEQPTSQA